MIIKTLTAGVLAVSLALTSMTPTQASADVSDGDVVLGIATLLLLGAAIHANNNDDDHSVSVSNNRLRSVPGSCRRHAQARNGRNYDFFPNSCLNRRNVNLNRLPQACFVHFRNQQNDHRRGFTTRCLQNHGVRTNRH